MGFVSEIVSVIAALIVCSLASQDRLRNKTQESTFPFRLREFKNDGTGLGLWVNAVQSRQLGKSRVRDFHLKALNYVACRISALGL